jgi:hypothetical protein
MTPLNIFLIPGEYALELILAFFQVPVWKLDTGLATVFAFFMSLIFWSWLLGIVVAIIKRQFGFGSRGR